MHVRAILIEFRLQNAFARIISFTILGFAFSQNRISLCVCCEKRHAHAREIVQKLFSHLMCSQTYTSKETNKCSYILNSFLCVSCTSSDPLFRGASCAQGAFMTFQNENHLHSNVVCKHDNHQILFILLQSCKFYKCRHPHFFVRHLLASLLAMKWGSRRAANKFNYAFLIRARARERAR